MSPQDDSLARARAHLRNAAFEGIEAARALLEAATRKSGVDPSAAGPVVSELARQLERLLEALRRGERFVLPRALGEPLAAALAAEIERWERRSQTDPDARPVLRAFLGLRELLYELGVRPPSPSRREPATSSPPRDAKRARVERFDVEG